jgi:hypothetical protein
MFMGMNATRRSVAAAEWVLIFPALLFFSALAARQLSPAADGIAMWYAGRQWTLPVLLIVLPLAVLAIGWKHRANAFVAAAMIAAAAVLVRVAIHFM